MKPLRRQMAIFSPGSFMPSNGTLGWDGWWDVKMLLLLKISPPAREVLQVASNMGRSHVRLQARRGLAGARPRPGASRQVTKTRTEAAAQGCIIGDKIETGVGK